MTTLPARAGRHLASSPFRPQPPIVIETYVVNDRVSHDKYGLGRIVGVEAAAVTVDFGSESVRIASPYGRMELLEER